MRSFFNLVLLAYLCVLAGCATTQKSVPAKVVEPPRYDVVMKRADDTLAAGKMKEALVKYKEVVDLYPNRKEPWQKMAQTQFDLYQYGPAIEMAQEVLRLDAADQLAHSIIAVSGLRLSSSSLGVLRRENSLSGSLKSEATALAEVLREKLGVEEIVPPAPKEKKPVRKVRRRVEESASPVAQESAPRTSGGGVADPFGSLQ